MFNKIIVAGRLGADPEVKTVETKSRGNQAVATFSLASTIRLGAGSEATEWFRVTRWGPQSAAIGKYLTKGAPVIVEGRFQSRKFEDKNGVTQTSIEIVADNVTFLPGNKPSGQTQAGTEGGFDEDSIPF